MGKTSRIIFPSLETIFLVKIIKLFYADAYPGSGIFLTLDPGSGINIRDPQHFPILFPLPPASSFPHRPHRSSFPFLPFHFPLFSPLCLPSFFSVESLLTSYRSRRFASLWCALKWKVGSESSLKWCGYAILCWTTVYNNFVCCAELSRALPELEADAPAAELPGRQQQDPHVR
jgi:hypothetical protein